MLFPDGLLSKPVALACWGLAGAALLYAAARARTTFPARRAPMFAGTAGLVFALQLAHFPLWTVDAGGRLLGGTLASILLGPWAGMLAAALATAARALLYQDGGVAALGANLLNVAVAGTLVGFRTFADLRRVLKGPTGPLASAFLGAVASNAALALALALEMQFAGLLPAWASLPTLLVVLAAVGVVEGLATLAWVGLARRWVPAEEEEATIFTGRLGRLGLGTTLLLALVVSPLSAPTRGEAEDPRALLGREFEFVPLEPRAPPVASPLLGYRFPGVEPPGAARALSGLAGLLFVWGIGWGLGRAAARPE